MGVIGCTISTSLMRNSSRVGMCNADEREKAGADTDKTYSSHEASVIDCNRLPCT